MNFTPFAYWSQVQTIDPDAQAFLTAAGITDPIIVSAIDQLVVDLKDNSLWSTMEAIYPFVGGTATTHKYNLKDPRDLDAAYRIGFTGGWTHSPLKGLIPNGSNTDGNTYFVGSGTDNDFALSYWTTRLTMDTNTAGLLTFGANSSATSGYGIIINRTGVNVASIMGEDNDIATFSYSDVPQQGLVVGSRTSSTSNKVYLDGSLKATTASSNTGTWPARTVRFGDPTSGVYNIQNSIFAHIGDGLNDTQTYKLYSIVDNFQTNLLYRVPRGTKSGAKVYFDTNSTFSYSGTGSTLFDLTYDSSDASISGPTYVSGTPSYFSFDGVNDFMNISNVASYGTSTTNFTVSGWVRFDTLGTFKIFATRGRDGAGAGWSLSVGVNSSNKPEINIVTSVQRTCTGTSTLSTNTWYYITGVWTNGTSLKIYLNGVLENTTSPGTSNLRSSTVYWDIGRINALYSDFDMSHVSIYHRALTDAEISNNYISTKFDEINEPIFNVGTGFNGDVVDIQVDDQDRIYVCGNFTTYKGVTQNRIVRLFPNGSINSTFDVSTGLSDLGLRCMVDSNGLIMVGGTFTSYRGTSRSGLVRINTDGTIDSSFADRTISPVVVRNIKECSYGYHIVGDFTSWNSNTVNGSVMVTSTHGTTRSTDGEYDATTLTVVLDNYIFSGDTSMIVGGFSGTTGGTTERIAYRYPSGGGVTRTTIGAENNFIIGMDAVSTGNGNYEIVVGGDYTTGSSVRVNKYTLSSTGTLALDSGFNPLTQNTGYSMTAGVFKTKIHNNKIYIGGAFTGNFNRFAVMDLTTGRYLCN